MPISRYPRPGHPIAPSLLAPLLDQEVPRTDLRFSELDASTWDKFSYARCCRLGRLLQEHLRAVRDLLWQVGRKRLASARMFLTVHQLELTRRSYNCLSNVSLVGRRYGIASLSVDEALAIRSFGVGSLVDVLTSVEAAVGGGSDWHAPAARSSRGPAPTIPRPLRERILETGRIPRSCRERRIPAVPEGVTLERLGLSNAAFNALTRAGYREAPGNIGKLTFHQCLHIPGLGTRGLCDLVEAIERLTTDGCSRNVSYPRPRDSWQVLLKRLRVAHSVPQCELAGYLPPLPETARLTTLGLPSGTQRVLERAGITDDLVAMRAMTIGQLMEIPGFGKTCLIDLIEAALRPRRFAGMIGPAGRACFREAAKAVDVICAAPGISRIDQSDPRLGHLLRAVHADIKTVGDLSERRNSVFIATRRHPLGELREAVERCLKQTVETELVDLLLSPNATSRNKRLIARHYGCGGRIPEPLEAIGNHYGITRERVRQLVAPTGLIQRANSVFLPALDASLRLIHAAIPAPRSTIEMRLVQEGLIDRKTSLRCIQFAAEKFRPEMSFELLGTGASEFALATSDIPHSRHIAEIVGRVVSRVGAGRLRDVLEHGDLTSRNQKTKMLVKLVIASMPDIHWLDPSERWIWSERWVHSGLRPKVMKVLSACRDVGIDALHAALLRTERTIEDQLPPPPILLELCRHVKSVRVDGRRVIARRHADLVGYLTPMEEIVVKLLKEHGPLCRSEDFQDEAFAMGVPVTALRKYLRFSLAITPYAKGVYGVVGQKITPLDLRRYWRQ